MNLIQIQNRVQSLPKTPETIQKTLQYLTAAMNGQVVTVPPYIAAAELKRIETDGVMDQLAQGAAKAQQTTVKDQLQQKMGIMALMGQQQPPQPPRIPQPAPPEQQPEAGGIDSLPVRDDMFGMAGGGIVAFQSGGGTGGYETPYDRMNRENREAAAQRTATQPVDIRVLTRLYQQDPELAKAAAAKAGDAGAALLERVIQSAQSTGPRLGSVPAEREGERAAQRQAAQKPMVTPEVSSAYPDETQRGAAAGLKGIATALPNPRPPAAAKPLGPRPPAAAKPPAEAGISLADQAPGASPITLADALGKDPAYQRVQKLAEAQNPYGGPQESQEDYIKRIRQGIRSQLPGGKMPYETSEARLKEIEGRRAKEDTEYAESNKGRKLDNLLTFISGMGRGSFGNAGMQGVEAVQKIERSQREEDLRRKDLRDQQSMRLMEIRALNDQAQMALAQGNVQAYEKLTQEAKKLKIDFDTTQASLNKDVATLGAGARGRDVEAAANERKLREESRQKQLGRESDERIARTRTAGRGEMTAAQAAKLRADATKALDKYLENAPYKERLAAKDPAERERLLQQRMDSIFQSGQGYTSGSPPPKPGGGAAPAGFTVQRDPK